MTIKDILIYLVLFIGTFLVICLGCTGLILSTMTDAFPNYQFIIALVLMFIATWTIGLGIRKHRSLIAERNK
ncbi:hypothetical protein U5N28_14075 [Lysinibacillus telephonicus]|uniref:Uncharacterized protein n=1 Tax=Lysinibacillus telephonicus TaxID=1714840 RepID=A0A3S0HBT0_9BACI|nr:hypothetical protein [Lysinibacillus telephonicus]RTQ87475.1 hypothetical protein EKG35_19040 [Lysinibacillus telephonicus]